MFNFHVCVILSRVKTSTISWINDILFNWNELKFKVGTIGFIHLNVDLLAIVNSKSAGHVA